LEGGTTTTSTRAVFGGSNHGQDPAPSPMALLDYYMDHLERSKDRKEVVRKKSNAYVS